MASSETEFPSHEQAAAKRSQWEISTGGAALITTPAWASEQSPQRVGGLRRWWGSVEGGHLGMLLLSKQDFDPDLFKQAL